MHLATVLVSYLEIIIITSACVGRRLNPEKISEVHPDKVTIVCTDHFKAFDPGRIVVRKTG